MDKNWVKIYSSSTHYKTELIRGLLLDNDINCVLINKKDSSYLFGEIELYVMTNDVIQAKHILSTQTEL